MDCREPITKDNPGVQLSFSHDLWQCNDCHCIEWGVYMWPSLLNWPGKDAALGDEGVGK
jgi:hypothetical protein